MDRRGFYWLIDGVLAGCGRPGLWLRQGGTGGDPVAAAAALDADLRWLQAQGIGALLSLTETPLPEESLARHGLDVLHLPVVDLTPPTPAQLDAALAFIDAQRLRGQPLAVHCLVGQGRTGTVLAAYLIRGGVSADVALRELRVACPGAVGSPSQETALRAFEASRAWIL